METSTLKIGPIAEKSAEFGGRWTFNIDPTTERFFEVGNYFVFSPLRVGTIEKKFKSQDTTQVTFRWVTGLEYLSFLIKWGYWALFGKENQKRVWLKKDEK